MSKLKLSSKINDFHLALKERDNLKRLLKNIVEYYCTDPEGKAVDCSDVHEAIEASGADLEIKNELF